MHEEHPEEKTAALLLQLERLRQADEMKRNFMAVVSHELRTPLAVVLGFSETLAAKAPDFEPEQVADIAQRTYNAAARLERLINDLIQVSQAERRRLHIEMASVDITAVIEQVTFETSDPNHPIELHLDDGLPEVETDPDRAVQVLDNLVTNARKFSPPGSTISITAHRGDDRVMVSVRDEGQGIPPDMQAKVFDPFFQVDQGAARGAGGLGIGLYLVRELCSRMDVSLTLESSEGQGSTFRIGFPISTEDPG